MSKSILSLKNVSKHYKQGVEDLIILNQISVDFSEDEFSFVVGPSGSGKSTLLHIIGLLDEVKSGDIIFCGESCIKMTDDEKSNLRAQKIGFIFQYSNLLDGFTALENVSIPLNFLGMEKKRSLQESQEILELVGLKDRMNHKPSELSGGEQQRVAIARAVVKKPQLIIADEPTGSLDEENAKNVMNLIVKCAKQYNAATIIATHNIGLTNGSSKIYNISHGGLGLGLNVQK